jgi:hypothetical protein
MTSINKTFDANGGLMDIQNIKISYLIRYKNKKIKIV